MGNSAEILKKMGEKINSEAVIGQFQLQSYLANKFLACVESIPPGSRRHRHSTQNYVG